MVVRPTKVVGKFGMDSVYSQCLMAMDANRRAQAAIVNIGIDSYAANVTDGLIN